MQPVVELFPESVADMVLDRTIRILDALAENTELTMVSCELIDGLKAKADDVFEGQGNIQSLESQPSQAFISVRSLLVGARNDMMREAVMLADSKGYDLRFEFKLGVFQQIGTIDTLQKVGDATVNPLLDESLWGEAMVEEFFMIFRRKEVAPVEVVPDAPVGKVLSFPAKPKVPEKT